MDPRSKNISLYFFLPCLHFLFVFLFLSAVVFTLGLAFQLAEPKLTSFQPIIDTIAGERVSGYMCIFGEFNEPPENVGIIPTTEGCKIPLPLPLPHNKTHHGRLQMWPIIPTQRIVCNSDVAVPLL